MLSQLIPITSKPCSLYFSCRALICGKSLHEKYKEQGFEVIGISCDNNREKFLQFLKKKEISWPQFYDGKQQTENKFAQEYGVDGIPHLLLIDKKGNLRFDRLHSKDGLEKTITDLLAE